MVATAGAHATSTGGVGPRPMAPQPWRPVRRLYDHGVVSLTGRPQLQDTARSLLAARVNPCPLHDKGRVACRWGRNGTGARHASVAGTGTVLREARLADDDGLARHRPPCGAIPSAPRSSRSGVTRGTEAIE